MDEQVDGGVIQFVPTVERIVYGIGALDTIGAELERLGSQRPMIVTARSLEGGRLVQRIAAPIGGRRVITFAAPFEHVPIESVAIAVAAARQHDADAMVAVGGGSVIDAAKAARLCIAAGLTTADDLATFMEHPGPLINGMIPQLSIPTTLAGAEYTRSFSATDFARGVKRSYTNSAVASRGILYDPGATLETPIRLWLASGVMALDHAVEVFCASSPHFVGDPLKLAAARGLMTALPRTAATFNDCEARLECQVAAWMADHSPLRAQPLKPAAAALPSHALAYELGALCRVSYGIVACVTLPASLRWTSVRIEQQVARQAEMSRALGLATSHVAQPEAAEWLADELERLVARLGLPTRLSQIGVGRDDLKVVASRFAARAGSLTGVHPASEDEVMSLLESAL
ncbi:MAG TPA: iron-containing alcohol dehydrogenase [Candidatus Binataceae bacterium]|nr:iron-containing alcohol dehydrogenase [Candidatus Binataceae bacterium]